MRISQTSDSPRLLAILLCAILTLVGCRASQDEANDAGTLEEPQSDSTAVECEGNLVLWPNGACAPSVEQCKPWEVPLPGECRAIGPRACPKTWDADSKVDCSPGTVLPCPQGFALAENDSTCIPLFDEGCTGLQMAQLGGGCRQVGPSWVGDGNSDLETLFDYCDSDELAIPGGGCALAGPRACPILWDPQGDYDCVLGDVLPCPDGWAENEDGLYCVPEYPECDEGMIAAPGGMCQPVVPHADQCPEGPFPEPPEDAEHPVYVDAESSCVEDCGSIDSPHPAIAPAIEAAPDGAHVLVAPGTYNEGLLLTRPVHVMGTCAANTHIAGAVQIPEGVPAKTSSAAVVISGTSQVKLTGLGIQSPAPGIVILDSDDVELSQLEVAGSVGAALYAERSVVDADSLWIHDTLEGGFSGGYGQGVWAGDQSDVSVNKTLVESARLAGVYVSGLSYTISLAVTHCTIRQTQPTQSGLAGYGVQVKGPAKASLDQLLVEGNHTVGILVEGPVASTLVDSMIRNMKLPPEGLTAYGIFARQGAALQVEGTVVDGSFGAGIQVEDSGTMADIERSVVREAAPAANGANGIGILVTYGAKAQISGSVAEHNPFAAISEIEEGTSLVVSGCVLRHKFPDGPAGGGSGLVAESGAEAVLERTVVQGNAHSGVRAIGTGTDLHVFGCTLRDGTSTVGGADGYGAVVLGGATCTFTDSLLERSRTAGIFMADSGTVVELDQCVLRDTLPNELGHDGHGIQAKSGSYLELFSSVLRANRALGIIAQGAKTRFLIRDSAILDTQATAEPGHFGKGIEIGLGAGGTVITSLLSGNAGLALHVGSEGSEATFLDSVVRQTAASADGIGRGVQIQDSASLTMMRCVVEQNLDAGILAGGGGSVLLLEASVIRGTEPNVLGLWGQGLRTMNGAHATLNSCLLDGNSETGMAAIGEGSQITATATTVTDTRANTTGLWGRGVELQDGAGLDMTGCALLRNRDASVIAVHEGTEAVLRGCLIKQTLSDNSGARGDGLIVGLGAGAVLDMTLVEEAETTGILVSGSKATATLGIDTSLTMINSAVVGTEAGSQWLVDPENPGDPVESQVFGDGVAVVGGAKAELNNCVLRGNQRCGIYFYDAAGTVLASVATENQS